MKFLLDTNAVIAVIAGNPNVIARLSAHAPADFGLSAIVWHELCYGVYKSARVEQNLARIQALRFEVLDLSAGDAAEAGEIRASLANKGTPIGPYDVLIAGQAKARSLTLVTHNTKEFERVEGLQFEDWQ